MTKKPQNDNIQDMKNDLARIPELKFFSGYMNRIVSHKFIIALHEYVSRQKAEVEKLKKELKKS